MAPGHYIAAGVEAQEEEDQCDEEGKSAEEIDARSDLYSLGVMFYEMLIGHKPYTGATAMEVIYKHKRAEMPEIAPQFADYQEILRRLLAKSPADRYQSAGVLLEAISAFKIPA